MSVANRIFTRMATKTEQNSTHHVLGMLHNINETPEFTASDALTSLADAIPVFDAIPDQQPDHSRFLIVITGTKGVLEIKGFQRIGQQDVPFQIITH